MCILRNHLCNLLTIYKSCCVARMSSQVRPKIFISRRIPEKGRAMVAAECDATCWNSDEPPPRKHYLQAVAGVDGLLCLLTDSIDSELLDSAGEMIGLCSVFLSNISGFSGGGEEYP